VLWIGLPSFHVFSATTKLITARESAGYVLSDAIQYADTVECNQSDIQVFRWLLVRPKHVILPLALPQALEGNRKCRWRKVDFWVKSSLHCLQIIQQLLLLKWDEKHFAWRLEKMQKGLLRPKRT
jgi:hypothetical protein